MSRLLTRTEAQAAQKALDECVEQAQQSKCLRAKCGSVVVDRNGAITGRGHNGPPAQCAMPECLKDLWPAGFRSDRTCCVHAEQRAIADTLASHGPIEAGSTIFFLRTGPDGSPESAGVPYCTICSKMALDVGIEEFVLLHLEGPTAYGAAEYNELSFAHAGPPEPLD